MNRSFIKYLIALLLFGTNGIVVSVISMGSMQIVFCRTLIGSILLLAIYLLTGGRFTFHHHWKQFAFLAVSGIAMGTSWMFLYEAYMRVGVSIASLLYYCGPVIVMVLSPLLFREKLTHSKVAGFLAVLVGIVLVNGNLADGSGDTVGIICGLMSAVTYSFMVICNKKATEIKGLENSVLQLIISFLAVAVFMGFTQGWELGMIRSDILPVLVLGLLNTGIGCYLYFSSIGKLKVQTVAVCGYLEPLSAVIFSVLLLGEVMLSGQILGAVLIIGGAMYGELAGAKKSRDADLYAP